MKPSIITGLSFELSALKYVMEKIPASLNDSVFQPCLSVTKAGREAFVKAVEDIAVLRKRTAWLLYNVHNQGPSTQGPERPFTVLKLFSAALKRSPNVFDKPQNYTDYNNEKHDNDNEVDSYNNVNHDDNDYKDNHYNNNIDDNYDYSSSLW
ncbi:hypothetical protein MRX96_029885 [Rhipicephalus microplus]